MIYDSNDLSTLFLPEKGITLSQYRELLAQKRRAVAGNGDRWANSDYSSRRWGKKDTKSLIFFILNYFIGAPANILALAFIKNAWIFLLLTPILLVISIISFIFACSETAAISRLPQYNAVCIGYLHRGAYGRTARVISAPLYRLETVNGPIFVHCELTDLRGNFPEIGQTKPLYIGKNGPKDCYDHNQKTFVIFTGIILGVNLLFLIIAFLVKAFS